MRLDLHDRRYRTGAARPDPGRNDRRLHAADAGVWRTDAHGELETGANRNFVPADRRHSRLHADRQSAWTPGLDPDDHASGFSGNPLLPRPDRRYPHRYRSRALQGVPAAAIALAEFAAAQHVP